MPSAFPAMGSLWDLTCKGEGALWKGGLHPDRLARTLAGFSLRIGEEMGRAEYEARYLEPKGRSLEVFEIERTVLAEVT